MSFVDGAQSLAPAEGNLVDHHAASANGMPKCTSIRVYFAHKSVHLQMHSQQDQAGCLL